MYNYDSSIGIGGRSLSFKGKQTGKSGSLPVISSNLKVKHDMTHLNGGFHSKTNIFTFYFRALKRSLKNVK